MRKKSLIERVRLFGRSGIDGLVKALESKNQELAKAG